MLCPARIRALLAASAFLCLAGTACAPSPPADVAALVPADATAALVVPPLSEVRPPLLAFADGMEGAQGLVDYVAQRYGVDLQSEDGLAAVGIDDRAGLALFWRGGLFVVALGVADAERFQTFLAKQLPLFGYGPPTPPTGTPAVAGARDRGTTGVPPIAFGVHAGRAVLALPLESGGASAAPGTQGGADPAPAPGGPDPVAAVRALLAGGGASALVSEPRFGALTAPAAPADGAPGAPVAVRAWIDLERTLLPPAAVQSALAPLGFAAGFVRPVVDGWDRLGVAVTVTPDRLAVTARVGRRPDAAPLPLEWVRPENEPAALGALLPSSTGLLLRLRFNAAKLSDLPVFVRRVVLAGNPFASFHPFAAGVDLGADVLPYLSGDLALAVIGLSDAASLASLDAATAKPAQLVRELDLALLVGLRDPEALAARVAQRVAEVTAGGAQATATPVEGARAWLLGGGNLRNLGVALVDQVAVVTVGRDAQERVLRAVQGAAPTLEARARTPLDRAVVGASEALLAAHLSFDRVARQLECKGFPPYFLKILTSPDAIAARLGAAPEGLTLELEVSQ
jgi:hypothetical protein